MMRNQAESGVMSSIVRLSLVALLLSLLLQKATAEVRIYSHPGVISLEWDPVPNASYYEVWGRRFSHSTMEMELLKTKMSCTFYNYNTLETAAFTFNVRAVYGGGAYESIGGGTSSAKSSVHQEVGPGATGAWTITPSREVRGPNEIYWGETVWFSFTDAWDGDFHLANRNNLAWGDNDYVTEEHLVAFSDSYWRVREWGRIDGKVSLVSYGITPNTRELKVTANSGKTGVIEIGAGDTPVKTVRIRPTYKVKFDFGEHATFQQGGGALLQVVHENADAVSPWGNVEYGWAFIGWNKPLTEINDDQIITALYMRTRCFVTFELGEHAMSENGDVVLKTDTAVGGTVQVPEFIVDPGWELVGWDKSLSNVYDDFTVRPVLKQIPIDPIPSDAVADWYVDATNGSDANSGKTPNAAFATIQKAVDSAGYSSGQSVLVNDGVYEPFDCGWKDLTIKSVNGSKRTVIDGGGKCRCATFGSNSDSELIGFTLRHGQADYGGGSQYGFLSECVFVANSAKYGGGAYRGWLKDCSVIANSASQQGGGIHSSSYVDTRIEKNKCQADAKYDDVYSAALYYSDVVDDIRWFYSLTDNVEVRLGSDNDHLPTISKSTAGTVTIPATLGGHKVSSIGDSAFSGCAMLESVVIPSSVTSVGENAFEDCDGLISVTISKGMKSIGAYAFYGCSRLAALTIPSSVTRIGRSAFGCCTSLALVSIPSGVVSLEGAVFDGCSGLESVMIPEGVTSIGDYAFSDCSRLTAVTIPSTVKSIGEYAFSGCYGLVSVSIPPSVTQIGECAFSGCSGLADEDGFVVINNVLFDYCGNAKSVVIPSCVARIDSFVFDDCAELERLWLPPHLTSIGVGAFGRCSALKELTIPEGVAVIEDGTFAGCVSLKTIELPSSVMSIGSCAFDSCLSLLSIEISSGVEFIGNNAFVNCQNLERVYIPTSLTRMETSVFAFCNKLQKIEVDCGDVERVKELLGGDQSIMGCGVDICDLRFVERGDADLVISPERLPAGVVGAAYQQQLSAEGGQAPYTWSEYRNISFFAGEYKKKKLDNAFAKTGIAQGWRENDKSWRYDLPFSFPFFRKSYSSVWVGSNGTLSFAGPISENAIMSIEGLQENVMIDLLWGEMLDLSNGDIYVDAATECVTIRWHGKSLWSNIDIDSSIALHASGSIRLSYGETNTYQSFGVSAGDGTQFEFSSYSTIEPTVFPDILLTPKTNSDLPLGLSLSADGVLSGVPSEVSTNSLIVMVTDATGRKSLKEYECIVCNAGSIVATECPTIEGDEGATVTGDAETGFVIKPSEGKTAVAVTIPQGVDAAKVTVEVSPKVVSVKPNGAKVKIVSGGADITEFLNVPAADGNGVVDLMKATVKEEIVKEVLDVKKGAEIQLNAADPKLTTASTRVGLFYQLREGEALDGMKDGDSKVGDGEPWTPEIKVKGGNSAFYSIGVGKGE